MFNLSTVVEEIGGGIRFFFRVARVVKKRGLKPTAVLDQVYQVGVHSLAVTIIAGLFVGAILAIQINLQIRDFGAESFLGGLSTSVTLRNLGPVLIAFLLSGKVGAYTAAELATMKITDQLSAITCLGADPVETIIAPRLVAVVLSSFLLLLISLGFTVLGGMAIASFTLGVNAFYYLSRIPQFLTWSSVEIGIFKSFLFGCIISGVSCYQGYSAHGGVTGVGVSVRKAAVYSLVSIIVCDFVVSVVLGTFQTFFQGSGL